MSRYIYLFILLSFAFNIEAQELSRAVRKFNPELFINNIDNEKVYQQANIRENLVIFSRGFENRTSIEEKQQTFHYQFLEKNEKSWILEFKFDRHDINLPGTGFGFEPLICNDFGLRVFLKEEEKWQDKTLECLPPDFTHKIGSNLPELLKSNQGMYFYNQDPEHAVVLECQDGKIYFKQNGKTVLTIVWKKDKFVWKK